MRVCCSVLVSIMSLGVVGFHRVVEQECWASTAVFERDGKRLQCDIDSSTGNITGFISRISNREQSWLHGPSSFEVYQEVQKTKVRNLPAEVEKTDSEILVHRQSSHLPLTVEECWAQTVSGLAWTISIQSQGSYAGHEVILELPILNPYRKIFTPTDRGLMSLKAYPTYTPTEYGQCGWGTGETYILPLVSIFEPNNDCALTLALAPDDPIPHFQVEWSQARILRLRFKHRAIGAGQTATIRLFCYTHPADYRAAIDAYSADFPAYFQPGMPRGPFEGAFWYHHIQDHPDLREMARQNIRFIWSSFWFTHLGDYLPNEKEWYPYTYAAWWKLGQTMTDVKIQSFIRTMHDRNIGTFAYFNVTEYGGSGGRSGDPQEANRLLRREFADALILDAKGQAIDTWEGAMAMNPNRAYSLYPKLMEQIDRHLERLPELDGFVIDRLDWACRYDYGHNDGVTVIADRPVENMCEPVAAAIQDICQKAHKADKRVFLNHVWRVEVIRDADGFCDEYDKARVLGYVAPYRPVAAWHHRKSYRDDLLEFEAQLKTRLQFACQPQMIAHEFPISQQPADREAADLLEIFAPLFSKLVGKEQVLIPHCVHVTGANDTNLFRNQDGHYVVPVVSRTRFLSRRTGFVEKAIVTLRIPGTERITWAHVYSADGHPYGAPVQKRPDSIEVYLDWHETASVIVLGDGDEPAFDWQNVVLAEQHRGRLFPYSSAKDSISEQKPVLTDVSKLQFRIRGTHVGEVDGPVLVYLDKTEQGMLTGRGGLVDCTISWNDIAKPLQLELQSGDEGTWYYVQSVELLAVIGSGMRVSVAEWDPRYEAGGGNFPGTVQMRLRWRSADAIQRDIESNQTDYGQPERRDTQIGGDWKQNYGKVAAWIAVLESNPEQNGFRLNVEGAPFTWLDQSSDRRVLQHPSDSAQRAATCWFANRSMVLEIVPPNDRPYRLSLYLVDFDRQGRTCDVAFEDVGQRMSVSRREMSDGVYLTWTVTGTVILMIEDRSNVNAVVSGVFIDPIP